MEVDAEHRQLVTRPVAIALCGLPGAGKSTLAARLSAVLAAVHLDRDRLRAELYGKGGYSMAAKAALNAHMAVRLAQHLEAGRHVILDGMTLAREQDRRAFADIARGAQARWLLAWLDCPPELARARVSADRHHPAADRDVRLVDEVARRFEAPRDGMRLDAALPVETLAERLLRAVTEIPGNPF